MRGDGTDNNNGSGNNTNCRDQYCHGSRLLVSVLVFAVLTAASVFLVSVFADQQREEIRDGALALAEETGEWFSAQLDRAILPLFSIAQFATELDLFRDLPAQIGPAGDPTSLPFVNPDRRTHRNLTGVCDDPGLVSRFDGIAAAIKRHAKMEGILVNLQLAPQAVVCLLYPMNNTEDFEGGEFLDSTGAWGLDLLSAPNMRGIAEESLPSDEVGIAGPLGLVQCPDCDPFFIARLAIDYDGNVIEVDNVPYKKWGFATALINWKKLVEDSGIYQQFEERWFDFQLTRTDRIYDATSASYTANVVVLAETAGFAAADLERSVQTELKTTNNLWEITVVYDRHAVSWEGWVVAVCVVVSLLIAILVYVVLLQQRSRTVLKGAALAQEAKTETERNMTAYFAHELRNPLGAIDSALQAMPTDLPRDVRELIGGMQICSSFMSKILNSLLDVRKFEEGKVELSSSPFSLEELITDTHKMLAPSVRHGVQYNVISETSKRDTVLGDVHRIQQVFTNVITNAIKHTSVGSITISLKWVGDIIRFECKDTGPGISKEDLQRIKNSERFMKKGSTPGTAGLGLCIARKIVDLMGGSIRFESDPSVGPGTTCIVEFSLAVCSDPVKEVVSELATVSPIEEPISVLVVDDIRLNRSMLERRIHKAIAPNAVISQAATGEEAIAMCKKGTYDVIIVDQYMETAGGVLLGTDVVVQLRSMKLSSLVIGNSGNDMESEFCRAGADVFWKKPIPPNETIIRQLRQGRLNNV